METYNIHLFLISCLSAIAAYFIIPVFWNTKNRRNIYCRILINVIKQANSVYYKSKIIIAWKKVKTVLKIVKTKWVNILQ
jgi:hypothetical protein